MLKAIVFLTVAILIIISACSENTYNRPSILSIENVQPAHQKPSKVQFIFSLRDQDDHSIVIPKENLDDEIGITIKENDTLIDITESHGLIHTSTNFDMDLVLLLDFTESMASSDNGISSMVTGAKSLIDKMGETHRIAVMEFHNNDRAHNDTYSILQPFTLDKVAAKNAIDDFVSAGTYNGFSTCWDAIEHGLTLFPTLDDSTKVQALAFLSDGYDNSSYALTGDMIDTAIDKSIHLYCIGVGEVLESNEVILKRIANETGGEYYSAEVITELEGKFDLLIDDLGGNYKISYITPRSDQFDVKITLTSEQYGTAYIDGEVSGDLILGSDKDGTIRFTLSSIENDSATFYIRAEHLPRDIDKFRFDLTTSKPITITLVPESEGGLLGNWNAPQTDGFGYWITTGPELEFGDFGNLFKVTIGDVSESYLNLPIKFDNSIYENDIRFYGTDSTELDHEGNWTSTISIGN